MVERVAILGFGDIVAGPKVAAAVANFHGERFVEIRCWDDNQEKCDLMCRVLRIFLKFSDLHHKVFSMDRESCLEDASVIIVISNSPVIHEDIGYAVPAEEEPEGHDVHKYQTLRWISREDWPAEFIESQGQSDLVQWLNSFE